MDASQMLMTKDDQTRPVERSAFRTVWSKVGWKEAAADSKVTPLELNVDGPAGVQGRPPITVEEHLAVREQVETVLDDEQAQKDAAAETAVNTAEQNEQVDPQADPSKPLTAKEKRAAAASTSAGDSTQSTSPTDQ